MEESPEKTDKEEDLFLDAIARALILAAKQIIESKLNDNENKYSRNNGQS